MITAAECKPHERPWRNWAVDRNLDDRWLERLNDLETFSLTSICEGHIDDNSSAVRRHPRIILRPKETYMKALTDHWYDQKDALTGAIQQIWPENNTIIECEIQHCIVQEGDKLTDAQDTFFRITSAHKRYTIEFSECVYRWFRRTIPRIRTFDQFMKTLIIIKGERG